MEIVEERAYDTGVSISISRQRRENSEYFERRRKSRLSQNHNRRRRM